MAQFQVRLPDAAWPKKTPSHARGQSIEAGFIQARNLSSSELSIVTESRDDKEIFLRGGNWRVRMIWINP